MSKAIAIQQPQVMESQSERVGLNDVAQERRRDPKDSLIRAQRMATASPRIAEQCFFTLPRRDKNVLGPSIRLAEIVANTYGNLHIASRIVEEGATTVTARATVTDLETNTTWETECRRTIVYSSGGRYSPDMIAQTCNAACAIAQRNAVFKAVPLVFINEIFEQCKEVALGSVDSKKKLAKTRDAIIQHFDSVGVDAAAILKTLKRASVDDICPEDILTLKGLWNRSREEGIPIKELIGEKNGAAKQSGKKLEDLVAEVNGDSF
jgi:hypothetical protein